MQNLQIFFSNRMEVLADTLTGLLNRPLSSPFVSEQIVVQSRGMERWLSMHLARQHGICANIRFPFPVAFFHELFLHHLPEMEEEYPYEQDVLTWRILDLFSRIHDDPRLFPLGEYVSAPPRDLKSYQLARRLALLFDRYLIFRPEMIRAWEEDRLVTTSEEGRAAEKWQAALWSLLHKEIKGPHRAALQDRFLERMESGLVPEIERVSVFGISSLPPAHVQLFAALAEHTEVSFYVLNPCMEFWEDVVSRRQKIRKNDSLLLDVGHPLLSSWGKVNKDFLTTISMIVEPGISSPDFFVGSTEETLLSMIQSDILHLVDREETGEKVEIRPDDDSVQIHSCHSPMREMEVLSDTLLALLDKDPDLRPEDILIMTPDIETYAPYIKAVFEGGGGENAQIPFSLADRSLLSEGVISRALFALLETLSGRFPAGQVVSLLEYAPIRDLFGIGQSDLELIRHWIRSTNIRWGLDGCMRKEYDLPEFHQNTFHAGLDRMFLGLAMPGNRESRFGSVLPFDDIEGGEARTLASFAEFLHRLEEIRSLILKPHTLQEWSELLVLALDRFFSPDPEWQTEMISLQATLSEISGLQQRSGSSSPIELPVLLSLLQERLGTGSSQGRFLASGATFCAMVPMRSIPFRVICMAGLNHDTFPRRDTPPDFDLLHLSPQRGDRTLRDDDRSLFLEALLSARSHLIITYVGRNIQDNTSRPPSVLVEELIECIDSGFEIQGTGIQPSAKIVTGHKLQPFHPRYFTQDEGLFSYSRKNAEAARMLLSEKSHPPFLSAPLPEPPGEWNRLTLDSLISFFLNPSAFFVKHRLGADLRQDESQMEDTEPLCRPSGLDSYFLGEEMIRNGCAGPVLDSLRNKAGAEGILPPSPAGEFAFSSIADQALGILARLRERAGCARYSKDVFVNLNGWELTGTIPGVGENDILQALFVRRIRAGDLLRGWILLLAGSCCPHPCPSQILVACREAPLTVLTAPEHPEAILESLLAIFRKGLCSPLPFFPETSLAYASTVLPGGTHEQGVERAKKSWNPERPPRECNEPHFARCFSDPLENPLFAELSLAVFRPLLQQQERQ
ncbi:MAG: exodeoxyribonuclease V subunit gamma [Desulfovibrionales bacterium]